MAFSISALTKKQIIFIGFVIHIVAAYFSYGYHHCDELFQVYEFAGYKLGINQTTDFPWEFFHRMRSGIEPLVVFIFTKIANYLSITNPFTISFILRLCQGILSFWATVLLLNALSKQITDKKLNTWLWYFGLLFWCLPYFHVRLSSENFSTTLFIFGFVLCYDVEKSKYLLLKFFAAGLLFGLAFLCRFQMSFMVAGLFAWQLFILRTKIKYLLFCFLGIIVAMGIGVLVDKWMYSEWVVSWWNYLYYNFFNSRANEYGTQPVYFYITESFLQLIPPFSIAIIAMIIMFWIKFRTHVITWITFPFIILHFFIAHKELRFLFPMLVFLPFMVLYYFQSVQYQNNLFIKALKNRFFLRTFLIVNFGALLVFSLRPAHNSAQILKNIYEIGVEKNTALLYKDENPYSNVGSFNYFRNKNVTTYKLSEVSDTVHFKNNLYYFSEEFNPNDTLMLLNQQFDKTYCNFPNWAGHLNFNGWLDRATFSIYKRSTNK